MRQAPQELHHSPVLWSIPAARAGTSAAAEAAGATSEAHQLPSALGRGLVRIVDDQLGTPRGRCDKHNSKFSLSYETKV
jgi:hypothetical protein